MRPLGGFEKRTRDPLPNPAPDVLFSPDLWGRALESYARAANLTVKVFDAEERTVLGPVHPTPLFQLFDERIEYDPGLFAQCARRCLKRTDAQGAEIVSSYGLSVVGIPLVLDDRTVGAAVGGYAFVDYVHISEVQHWTKHCRFGFDRLWQVAREQKPVPQHRLVLNGELLQVLGDALESRSPAAFRLHHGRHTRQKLFGTTDPGRRRSRRSEGRTGVGRQRTPQRNRTMVGPSGRITVLGALDH